MSNKIEIGCEFLKKIAFEISKIAELVACTLGPRGRNVVIEKGSRVILTKDGHTVAKSISPDPSDPIKKIAARMLSDVTSKTVETAGDGTTTATVLLNAILENGVKYHSAGMAPSEISAGIKCAVDKTVEIISSKITKINSEEDIQRIVQVATISANGDRSTGKMIGEIVKKVGTKGIVTVQKSNSIETTTDCINGMRFDRGRLSPAFVSMDTRSDRFEYEDAYILVYDGKLESQPDFIHLVSILEKINFKPILIISKDMTDYFLKASAANNLSRYTKICGVKAPGYGDAASESLEDIALFCGATLISENLGMSLEGIELNHLGKANIIVEESKTTILNGNGNPALIEEKCHLLREKLEEESSSYAREKLEKRIANLKGRAGVINVGGMNELDQERKMASIEDALKAVQAAVEQGFLPGGGSSYLKARNELLDFIKHIKNNGSTKDGYSFKPSEDFISGMKCVANALIVPLKQSLKNADMEERSELIANDIMISKDPNFGFNVAEASFCNMLEAGIIDPYLCIASSLSNAGHYAADVISSGGIIYNQPKQDKERSGGMDMDY